MAATGDGCSMRRRRGIGAGQPEHALAACTRGDQKRGDDQDPYSQRDSDNDDRCFHLAPMVRRAAARRAGIQRGYAGNLRYAGIGIAMLTLIENTVRVTITHSDSEPIASEAATASASRDEATGAGRRSKPAGRATGSWSDFLHCAGESPANTARCRRARRQYCGDTALNVAKSRRNQPLCPLFAMFRLRRRPRHPAATPW